MALADPLPSGRGSEASRPASAPGSLHLRKSFVYRIAPLHGGWRPALAIQDYREPVILPEPSPKLPDCRTIEPRWATAGPRLFTVASAALAVNADRVYFNEIDTPAVEAGAAAGFFPGGLQPTPLRGFTGPLYVRCGFPLSPVWLPALFDIRYMQAGPRRCSTPLPPLQLHVCSDELIDADGPGFSGSLACPPPGAAVADFRENRKPEEVSMPQQLMEPTAPPAPAAPPESPQRQESPWQRALRSWRQAPLLVRYLAVVLPLTAAPLFYSPKISMQAAAHSSGANSWKSAVKARATVDLRDDFREGFLAWNGNPGWEKTWSIDGSGSAQPGRLALFSPTTSLTDYRFEFQAQILAKGLGMALRATDTSNYQAVKIGVVKHGPLSPLTLLRYAVIDGHEGPKTETPIQVTVQNDALNKVLVAMQDDHISVTVNGVFADAWSDSRFKSGGIGFFADKGEVARVRSVHVIDKEDFLGWLCYQVSQLTADSPTIGAKHE